MANAFIKSALQVQSAEYDFAKLGGAIGTIPLGIYVPKKSTTFFATIDPIQVFNGVGATISFGWQPRGNATAPDPVGIWAAFLANVLVPGGPSFGNTALLAAPFYNSSFDYELTMSIGVAPVTTGKLVVNLFYVEKQI